jgi:hypothetical protein
MSAKQGEQAVVELRAIREAVEALSKVAVVALVAHIPAHISRGDWDEYVQKVIGAISGPAADAEPEEGVREQADLSALLPRPEVDALREEICEARREICDLLRQVRDAVGGLTSVG